MLSQFSLFHKGGKTRGREYWKKKKSGEELILAFSVFIFSKPVSLVFFISPILLPCLMARKILISQNQCM